MRPNPVSIDTLKHPTPEACDEIYQLIAKRTPYSITAFIHVNIEIISPVLKMPDDMTTATIKAEEHLNIHKDCSRTCKTLDKYPQWEYYSFYKKRRAN